MPQVNPLHLCIFLGPLAVYFLLLGAINLARRPFLTTGARDAAALGVAVSGFAIAGPMDLFMPENAAANFGVYAWLMMLALYGLGLTLLALLMRPRMVVYNLSADQLRPILGSVAAELDEQVRWAGDSLVLPRLGVQLTVEASSGTRCSQLVAAGPRQSYPGWRRLEIALGRALKDHVGGQNPYGFVLCGMGIVMVIAITIFLSNDPQTVAQQFRDLLRR